MSKYQVGTLITNDGAYPSKSTLNKLTTEFKQKQVTSTSTCVQGINFYC